MNGMAPVGSLLVLQVSRLLNTLRTPFFVIPAEAGFQKCQGVAIFLDPGFRRGDDL
jgi:hypothetical protein